jgi:hypothetical protein
MTQQEKEILRDMIDAYCSLLDNKSNSVSEFIGLAHETGDIASSGDLYEKNVRFFEVKDSIKSFIAAKKASARLLINKIISEK